MLFKTSTFNSPQIRNYTINYRYNIPDRYRNAFYLANAALFDNVNWFVHRSLQVCYKSLIEKLLEKEPTYSFTKAFQKIQNVINIYEQCNSIIDVRFPIKRKNDQFELIRGFRAHHGLYSGYYPCLGGLRIHENITRDQMKALACLSSYKHACMGINLSGGFGGIKIDPLLYDEAERKSIVEQYTSELYKKGLCGGQNDIVEPDVNSSTLEMSWIATAYALNIGQTKLSCNTAASGKPAILGGFQNHQKSTSQGVFFGLQYFINEEEIMKQIELPTGLENKTFIIQGLGKVGTPLIEYLEKAGAMCVGVKDANCYIYEETGINVKELLDHKNKYGSILYFKTTKPTKDEEILQADCDILVLAATEKTVKSFIAEKSKAKVIVEAANAPISPISNKILLTHKKLIIPDIFVCSGSSIVSYLEYLVNLRRSGFERVKFSKPIYENLLKTLFCEDFSQSQIVLASIIDKIKECSMEDDIITYGIESIMTETANEIMAVRKKFDLGLDIRTAAYIVAFQNIFKSIFNYKKY